MTTPKILIADSISQRGIDELTRDGAFEVSIHTGQDESALVKIIPDFSGVVVRSQTKITGKVLNAGTKLRVVGRAGVGIDNGDGSDAARRDRDERPGRKHDFDRRTCFFSFALRRAKDSTG